MGILSLAHCHEYTDKAAAHVAVLIEAYQRSLSTLRTSVAGAIEPFGQANEPMYEIVDETGDAEFESAVSDDALAWDKMATGPEIAEVVSQILGHNKLRALHSALRTYVLSDPGGDYSSFSAYLTGVNAYVDAAYAELARAVDGESAFGATTVIANVCCPTYQGRSFERVLEGTDGALADETTNAADVGAGDIPAVPPLWDANGDTVYLGSRRPFSAAALIFSQVASSTIYAADPVIQYFAGSSGWVTLTAAADNLVDGTTGATVSGVISWDTPAGWEPTNKDASDADMPVFEALYYIRIERTVVADPAPNEALGTWFRAFVDSADNAANRHLGLPQGPLGYIEIIAGPAIQVTVFESVQYDRFVAPGSGIAVAGPGSIRLRSLTGTGGVPTWSSWGYIDQDGNNVLAQATGLAAAGGALGVGDWYPVADTPAMAGGDTGIRSIIASATATWTIANMVAGEAYEINVVPPRYANGDIAPDM